MIVAIPWPTPTHIVHSAYCPPVSCELVRRGEQQPRARHAERMTERDRAAVRIDPRIVVGEAELAETGERLRGEGFVQLDDGHVVELSPPLQSLSVTPAPVPSP